MKICLSDDRQVEGYINLNAVNLDDYCEPSQCDEILVRGILEYVSIDMIVNVLRHWASKLRHNAKLIIVGSDLIEIAKNILYKNTLVPDANKQIFGNGQMKSMITLDDLSTILVELGLKIKSRQLNGIEYTVEAFRP